MFFVVGIVGWFAAAKLRIPGASLIGSLILSAVFSLTGLINSRPPIEMLWAAQFFIGIGVGVRYAGITAYEVCNYVLAGAAYSLLTGIVNIGVIWIIIQILGFDPLSIFLSFLPGEQAEMAMIAIISGADVAYVVAHHVLRILLVIIFAQFFAGWRRRR